MLKNTIQTLTYTAWNTSTGLPCSGDVSAHTCRISKDGGAFTAAANTPSELENGVYALTLTASETNCTALTLSVASSTSGVVIPPVQAAFDDVSLYKADVSSVAANVWNAASRTLTGAVTVSGAVPVSGTVEVSSTSVSAIQSGLATSAEITTVSGKIDALDEVCDAVQVRTNLIPDRPAAVGSAMTLTDDYAGLLSLDANTIAAGVLGYDISGVEASAPLFSLCTIILAHLQSAVNGSTWTIYRTNGITQHAARTLTASEDSTPVTGVSGTGVSGS